MTMPVRILIVCAVIAFGCALAAVLTGCGQKSQWTEKDLYDAVCVREKACTTGH